MALLPLATSAMRLNELNKLASNFPNTELMPILFMGHGSPMNAIEENEFTKGFRNMGSGIPKPRAIICVSAHWETNGTFVTTMTHPQTIHDFGGFPQALFDVQYPAPGSPEIAHEAAELIKTTKVGLDEKWGLDHGAWSVIRHLYPKADIPVIQISLDYKQQPQYHYDLAKELYALRRKGVLIIGSGNMVHNLGMLEWNKLNIDFAIKYKPSTIVVPEILDEDIYPVPEILDEDIPIYQEYTIEIIEEDIYPEIKVEY